MRPYETLILLGNELSANAQPFLDRLQEVIRTNGGSVDATHDWGTRKLAYVIKKQTDARYFLLEYSAEPAAVSEVERTLRITDGVLRYISVQQDHTGLPQPRTREAPAREHVPLHELRSHRGGGSESNDDAGEPSRGSDEPETPRDEKSAEDTE